MDKEEFKELLLENNKFLTQEMDSKIKENNKFLIQEMDSKIKENNKFLIQEMDSKIKENNNFLIQKMDSKIKENNNFLIQKMDSKIKENNNFLIQKMDKMMDKKIFDSERRQNQKLAKLEYEYGNKISAIFDKVMSIDEKLSDTRALSIKNENRLNQHDNMLFAFDHRMSKLEGQVYSK